MDNESVVAAVREEKEKKAAAVVSLLKTLKDTLHNNKITQKKEDIHKSQSIADTERLWTDIDTRDITMGIGRVLVSDDNSGMGDLLPGRRVKKDR